VFPGCRPRAPESCHVSPTPRFRSNQTGQRVDRRASDDGRVVRFNGRTTGRRRADPVGAILLGVGLAGVMPDRVPVQSSRPRLTRSSRRRAVSTRIRPDRMYDGSSREVIDKLERARTRRSPRPPAHPGTRHRGGLRAAGGDVCRRRNCCRRGGRVVVLWPPSRWSAARTYTDRARRRSRSSASTPRAEQGSTAHVSSEPTTDSPPRRP
jgi:hypothetical protein